MKLTFKAIARAAGYYTYEAGGGAYAWRNYSGWINEAPHRIFNTEADAYKDCCISCDLVETTSDGVVVV